MSDKLLTPIEIGLTAAIVAVEGNEPMILIAPGGDPCTRTRVLVGPAPTMRFGLFCMMNAS